jgi:hypothetical protein
MTPGSRDDATASALNTDALVGRVLSHYRIEARLGSPDKAFEWLDRAYVQRDAGLRATLRC